MSIKRIVPLSIHPLPPIPSDKDLKMLVVEDVNEMFVYTCKMCKQKYDLTLVSYPNGNPQCPHCGHIF